MAVRVSGGSEAAVSHQTAPQIPHIGGAFPVTRWYAIIDQKLIYIVAFTVAVCQLPKKTGPEPLHCRVLPSNATVKHTIALEFPQCRGVAT